MKVAVIGGTGFVGSYLIDELLKREYRPVLLVRPGSEHKIEQRSRCTLVPGDVKDQMSIRKALEGCDAAIYNIGILREFKNQGITFEELQYQGAVRTIDAAVELDVKRFLLMSANGAKPEGTPYQTTKYRAEQYLKSRELDWTIFRPSVIFGDPKGKMEFCTQLKKQMIDSPLPAPLFYEGPFPFNAGSFKMAPVYVGDVTTIFIESLTKPEAIRQTYGLCGPDTLEWKAIIETIARAVGKHKLALPAPAFAVKSVAALLDNFEFFPISRDQIAMLLEGNTCDSSNAFTLFGVTPVRFNENNLSYLQYV